MIAKGTAPARFTAKGVGPVEKPAICRRRAENAGDRDVHAFASHRTYQSRGHGTFCAAGKTHQHPRAGAGIEKVFVSGRGTDFRRGRGLIGALPHWPFMPQPDCTRLARETFERCQSRIIIVDLPAIEPKPSNSVWIIPRFAFLSSDKWIWMFQLTSQCRVIERQTYDKVNFISALWFNVRAAH